VSQENRIASMTARLEALAGRVIRVESQEAAGAWVRNAIENRTSIVSNAPYLEECGITRLPGVHSGIIERGELQQLCATADVGITSADYALADTGSLVMLSSPQEARMISLLPPAHIAIVPCNRLLSGLDELFSLLPEPASASSSMVLITGPSRTADIEQILVRGVHGPGQITVVLVG
jgi:L-lactate utilization protein LutC